jgi:hypothetical protein
MRIAQFIPVFRAYVAERVRFELTSPVKGLRFSRPVHSTALPPLRLEKSVGYETFLSQTRGSYRPSAPTAAAHITKIPAHPSMSPFPPRMT